MTAVPTIAVITATLNAEKYLPRLIKSLHEQTDGDFEWIVADGNSTDATARLVESSGLRARLLQGKDFGIYDALNRAVAACSCDYYLVIGADDTLTPNALHDYRAAAHTQSLPDLVAAAYRKREAVHYPHKRLGWLYGMLGVASSHSVGLLIKRDLHTRFGWYSSKFPIAADQLFVKTAITRGASVHRERFVAGEFSVDGTSGTDSLGVISEIFRVQVRTERFALLQYLIFMARLMNYFRKSLLKGDWGR